jgi:transposase
MTKTQVEVITSVQRRRRWSRAEKDRIVAAAIAPGAVASEVAREAGIHASQLFRWRQELCRPVQAASVFSPVVLAHEPEAASAPALPAPMPGAIEVEFATGARMRITGPVDASTVRAMIAALAKSKRRR